MEAGKVGIEIFENYNCDNQLSFFQKEKSTDWKWSFKDYPKEKNGLKVFSCFSCGGGSTMGYKLAGCEVIGNVEIDPKMNEVYVKNHNPKYNYLMDIREFNKLENLPEELYNLDILDGSPPCTTFSMAGLREESWGKKKKFREGQAEQTLDDLSFVFIETVNKLKPKVVIMENVEGLIKGEAWGYVQEIYKQFKEIGYSVKHWLLKGEEMGVPQKRHRVFFIATRLDFNLEEINLHFDYEKINYGEIRGDIGKPVGGKVLSKLCDKMMKGDKNFSDIAGRELNRPNSFFNTNILYDNKVCNTVTAHDLTNVSFETRHYMSDNDIIHSQTFPEDYDFTKSKVCYICGMSVPPIMIKRIVLRLLETDLFQR